MRRTNGRTTRFPDATDQASTARFAADVQYYLALSPRQLPSRYFYDELGSALFEAICRLPWYGLTRAESRLLAAHGSDIFRRLASVTTIVELGSGSGDKMRMLIEAANPPQPALTVHLVDVSRSALEASARMLRSLPDVDVVTHEAPYEPGLGEATADTHPANRTLVLFLGSNLGNFDRPGAEAFLHSVRAHLAEGDALLLGTDLVKPDRELLLAYDDPLGVTAAFNCNLLARINRELRGNFDLDQFAHRAVWNADESRVEMHLVARSAQEIRIERAQMEFRMEPAELIWTESSYKYRPHDVVDRLASAGFRLVAQWIDREDPFALTLVEAA